MTVAGNPLELRYDWTPINLLVRVAGTPLAADQGPIDQLELVRMIGAARILMPASMVRLTAGRLAFG